MSEQHAHWDGVVATRQALSSIKAGEALGEALHPRIESRVRCAWNGGDFETAIHNAEREIEIAVGEHLQSRPGAMLCGVDLINAAFGEGKPLADPAQDRCEQEGTRALYAGFVGTFGSPGSHRLFESGDAVQPADIIRTADLLMRMLDDIAAAQSARATT